MLMQATAAAAEEEASGLATGASASKHVPPPDLLEWLWLLLPLLLLLRW